MMNKPEINLKRRALFSLAAFSVLLFSVVELKAQQETKAVYFDFNSAQLNAAAQKSLGAVVAFCLGNRKIKRIEVNGYADTSGSSAYNLKLSDQRAEAVKGYLLSHGLQSTNPKILVNYYGENRSRGRSVEEQRAVTIKIYFAYPDRDTVLRIGCVSIKIDANTFGNFNINELDLQVTYAGDAQAAQRNGLVMEDTNGNTLLSNGMVRLNASYRGKPVSAEREIAFTLPELNNRDGYAVYTGYQENGVVKWKQTDEKMKRTMDSSASLGCGSFYTFRSRDVNSWKNLDKVENCNCAKDGFGGITTPEASDTRSLKGSRSSILFTTDNKKNVRIQNNQAREFRDLLSKEEIMDYCEQLKNPQFLVFPSFGKLRIKPESYFEVNAVEVNGGKAMYSVDNGRYLIAIPKSSVGSEDQLALIPGTKKDGKFQQWDRHIHFPKKCIGLINCEYVVFEVQLEGYYALVSVESEPKKVRNKHKPNKDAEQNSVSIKVKKAKSPSAVFADTQSEDFIATTNQSSDKFTICKTQNATRESLSGRVVVIKVTKGKDIYGYVKYADKVPYRKSKKQFVVRRLKKYSEKEWEAELQKYCGS